MNRSICRQEQIEGPRWWVAVEFERVRFGRKRFEEALQLLDNAAERYDLILPENGKTLARGIFDRSSDRRELARLIGLVGNWSGAVLYHIGSPLDLKQIKRLGLMLACAADGAICRSYGAKERPAWLGCHLPPENIGLFNYSRTSLKQGRRFWISFLRPEHDWKGRFILDKPQLEQKVAGAMICPEFPEHAIELVRRLPLIIDLNDPADAAAWAPAGRVIKTHWLSRFPPILPRSEQGYREWLSRWLAVRIDCG